MGRRPLLLIGIAGITHSRWWALGFVFRRPDQIEVTATLAVISMMAYVAAFCDRPGAFFWLMISEIYPLKIRSSTEGLSAAFNWGANLLVSLTFLTLVQELVRRQPAPCAQRPPGVSQYYRVPRVEGTNPRRNRNLLQLERSDERIRELLYRRNQWWRALKTSSCRHTAYTIQRACSQGQSSPCSTAMRRGGDRPLLEARQSVGAARSGARRADGRAPVPTDNAGEHGLAC